MLKCKDKTKDVKRVRERRNMEFIRLYKEMHQCCSCDEGRTACLDLHHRDPATKRFALSDAQRHSIKAIEAELRKCMVICANCHRILHAEDVWTGLAVAKDEDVEAMLFDEM